MTARKAARAKKTHARHHKSHHASGTPRTPPPEVIRAAQETERETGVPASATLGQWALESGFGKHTPGNNPFGIKARKGEPYQLLWTHEKAKNGSGLVRVQQKFRTFASLDDAFRARGELLSKHYPIAMAHTNDPNAFVAGLQAAPHHKYATDPNYVSEVTDMMRRHNFYQYDLKGHHSSASSGGAAAVRLVEGEPTVVLGTEQRQAAHIQSKHTGGGKMVEGSATVFVGPSQLAFSRYGDTTNDQYQVITDVQDDVLVG
jgi:hypothetical protein